MPSSSQSAGKNPSSQTAIPIEPQVVAFYASLSPKDRLVHELATTMLKTRYNPKRSNAYLAFQAAQEKKGAA